jgi:hypothetical protein
MPEPNKRVLIFNGFINLAVWIPAKTVLADDFYTEYDGDDMCYDEELDCFYVPSDWYETPMEAEEIHSISGSVFCWMELPEEPKKLQ